MSYLNNRSNNFSNEIPRENHASKGKSHRRDAFKAKRKGREASMVDSFTTFRDRVTDFQTDK